MPTLSNGIFALVFGSDPSNPVNRVEFKGLTFHSGGIERRFVSVPHGATHALVRIRCAQLLLLELICISNWGKQRRQGSTEKTLRTAYASAHSPPELCRRREREVLDSFAFSFVVASIQLIMTIIHAWQVYVDGDQR